MLIAKCMPQFKAGLRNCATLLFEEGGKIDDQNILQRDPSDNSLTSRRVPNQNISVSQMSISLQRQSQFHSLLGGRPKPVLLSLPLI